uniref:Uncharacterized protein n=1 Tax=Siphoviridae sp. ctCIv11 TaxID=2827806 RepID=A0A8S5S2I4_9CAUD|nr:MAG TPA: hypothetical protein [Siphoviridae sp. ctCIv11]
MLNTNMTILLVSYLNSGIIIKIVKNKVSFFKS